MIEDLKYKMFEKDNLISKVQNHLMLKDSEVISVNHEYQQLRVQYSEQETELWQCKESYAKLEWALHHMWAASEG